MNDLELSDRLCRLVDQAQPVDLDEVTHPRVVRGHRLFVVALAAVALLALVAGAVALLRVDRHDAPPITTQPVPPATNGWVAFTEVDPDGDSGVYGDTDVYLVREGASPRRLAGSDTDGSDQVCPAFSPDGGRLVFGQATGSRGAYANDAELVLLEVGADGAISGPTTIPVQDLSAPPCALWSPDGRWLAFGAGSEVRLVDAVTQEQRRLAGYAATDLEWLPGTDELAIADNGIDVYSVATGEVRSLGIDGAETLTSSPDGAMLAFTRTSRVGSGEAEHDNTSLWLADADGTDQRQVGADYRVLHGVGPVWSPDGHSIAYQRSIGGGESHEVVLVSADPGDADNPLGTETVIAPPTTPGTDGPLSWYPWSVTWSPDGTTLLYIAWNDACYQASPDCGARPEGGGVLAVPVDTTTAPFILANASWLIGAKEGQPWLPMQSWGAAVDDSSAAAQDNDVEPSAQHHDEERAEPLDPQTVYIDAEEQDGEVTGEFQLNGVVVTIQCSDTDNLIDSEVRLVGVVTDNPHGRRLRTFPVDGGVGRRERLREGDLVALIVRDRAIPYTDDRAGSCTELLNSIPNLDAGWFHTIPGSNYSVNAGGEDLNP